VRLVGAFGAHTADATLDLAQDVPTAIVEHLSELIVPGALGLHRNCCSALRNLGHDSHSFFLAPDPFDGRLTGAL